MSQRSLKVKENWRHWTPELAKIFLRSGPEGKSHPSRLRVLGLIEGLSSVLDVGCGNGVMFEMIRERKLDLDYLGIDVTEKLLAVARQLFPADAHRFRRLSLYELKKLRNKFDAVVCRHVLEHLPDYAPALQSMYSCARKKVIIVFYLPPTPSEIRIHLRQGKSDPRMPWADRPNVIYEVIRPIKKNNLSH